MLRVRRVATTCCYNLSPSLLRPLRLCVRVQYCRTAESGSLCFSLIWVLADVRAIGSRQFHPWLDQHSGSWKNWGGHRTRLCGQQLLKHGLSLCAYCIAVTVSRQLSSCPIFNNYWTRLSKIALYVSDELFFSEYTHGLEAICHFNARAIARRRNAPHHLRRSRVLFAAKLNTVGRHCAWADHYSWTVICRSLGGLLGSEKEEKFA